jgi:hypothetical protein
LTHVEAVSPYAGSKVRRSSSVERRVGAVIEAGAFSVDAWR